MTRALSRAQDNGNHTAVEEEAPRRLELAHGREYIVRFLPARFGPQDSWYVRIARHSCNGMSVVCPERTDAWLCGVPRVRCAICALANVLGDSPDAHLNKVGHRFEYKFDYLTQCLLLEEDGVRLPSEEVLNPYQLLLQQSAWEELVAHVSQSPVLGYLTGSEFAVSRTRNDTEFVRLRSTPIINPEYANFGASIQKLDSVLMRLKSQILEPAQLKAFANTNCEFWASERD